LVRPSGTSPGRSKPPSRASWRSPLLRDLTFGSDRGTLDRSSMRGRQPCQRLAPRRHIGVTCGGSRTPTVRRCSHEHGLSWISPCSLAGGHGLIYGLTVTGRRGLLTRPSLLFFAHTRSVAGRQAVLMFGCECAWYAASIHQAPLRSSTGVDGIRSFSCEGRGGYRTMTASACAQ
jgi:hypothetical protein